MIDPDTGTIRLDEPKLSVGRKLTLTRFRRSRLARMVENQLVGGAGYRTFRLSTTLATGGIKLGMALCFQHERLDNIELWDDNPAFGTSWDDWSEQKERRRKASHDRWLRQGVGGRRYFRWGEVWSGYDERGGFSSIVVQYYPRLLPRERARPVPEPLRRAAADMKKLLQRVLAQAARGNTDYCILLESRRNAKRWLELTHDSINAAYPRADKPTAALLQRLGLPDVPNQKLVEWEPGLCATFEHLSEPIDQIAAFIAAYFESVLQVSPARRALKLTEKQL